MCIKTGWQFYEISNPTTGGHELQNCDEGVNGVISLEASLLGFFETSCHCHFGYYFMKEVLCNNADDVNYEVVCSNGNLSVANH